jgi:hypothetical protein
MTRPFEVIENARVLTRHDAAQLADCIIDLTIKTLLEDRKSARTYFGWALMLADLRNELTDKIAEAIVGRADDEELIAAVQAALFGDVPDDEPR